MKHIFFKAISLLLLSLSFGVNSSWADSMPSMKDTITCSEKTNTKSDPTIQSLKEKLQHQLEAYNVARFKMSDVLRAMVVDYSLQGYSKKRLLSYAEHFEDMRNSIPNFNPNTAEYKNFDFRLGMSFASTVIFLNSTADVLEKFQADQKNPESNINKYIVEIDKEEGKYTHLLNEFKKKDAERCVS